MILCKTSSYLLLSRRYFLRGQRFLGSSRWMIAPTSFTFKLFSELCFLGLAIWMMDTSILAFNCKELVVFVPGSQMYLCQAHKCICSRITNVMPSHYRLMLLQSLLSTNHYEFLISLHDRSSQSRTKGPVARATKSCLEILFSLIILSIYEIYIFASLFKVWWFPRAPWRDLIGNSNLPSRRSTQLFLVFARRLRLLSLPFLSFFRTICYFLTVIHLAEIAKSGFWKWRIKKKHALSWWDLS